MTVKTKSGIKRFQEEKELGNWFGKLLPVVSSMDNCQPTQSIEPGMEDPKDQEIRSASEADENDSTSESNKDESVTAKKPNKRKSYVPAITKKKAGKTEAVLEEIKEAVSSIKSLASDNSSRDILQFLKEESARQSEMDTAFLQLMSNLIQQQPQSNPPNHQMSFQPPSQHQAFPPSFQTPTSHPYFSSAASNTMHSVGQASNGHRYGMTSATISSGPQSASSEYNASGSDESFTSQLMSPDYPL